MSDVKRLVKAWINDNCCDGDDRSKASCDWHKFTAPELYEMGDDIAEMIQEDIIDKLVEENDRLKAEKAELVEILNDINELSLAGADVDEFIDGKVVPLLNKLQ